jgi:hypothetical protein
LEQHTNTERCARTLLFALGVIRINEYLEGMGLGSNNVCLLHQLRGLLVKLSRGGHHDIRDGKENYLDNFGTNSLP